MNRPIGSEAPEFTDGLQATARSGKEAAVFELLKQRLLLRRLDEIPDTECHARIIHEAEMSAALARRTAFPLLLFPCLFEERARAVRERQRQFEKRYWALAA